MDMYLILVSAYSRRGTKTKVGTTAKLIGSESQPTYAERWRVACDELPPRDGWYGHTIEVTRVSRAFIRNITSTWRTE